MEDVDVSAARRIGVVLGGSAVPSRCGDSGHRRCDAGGCARAAGAAPPRQTRRTESQAFAEGIPLTDLLAPVRILVALVLAFVLVQTFSSYEDASDAADDEAGAVSAEAVAAALLPPPTGPPPGCPARAAMPAPSPGRDGARLEATRRTSSISNDADARVAAAVAQAEQTGISETLVAQVVTAERDRAAARRVRLAEAEPSVPAIVTATPDWLRRRHRRVHGGVR